MEGVSEFFKEQNVLITGGTGFLGKVLIEKLLRSCPEVGNIYLLTREKKGKSLNDRVKNITETELFDMLKRQYPENLKKLVPIYGNCMELGLGLSESDRQLLEENVNVIYHVAASVRFDDNLKKAILLNTRATRDIMLLARNTKNLKVLVHVSTSFCACDKKYVEEKMYPASADWKKFIEVAESTDDNLLNILTSKVLDSFPNTYLFSKAMAEHVVNDLRGDIPTVIARPTIVTSSLNDPIAGWIDNFYGALSFCVAAAKGVLRVFYGNPNVTPDYVPVDIVIKVLCSAAWKKAKFGNSTEPSIYNIGAWQFIRYDQVKLHKISKDTYNEYPYSKVLWKEHITIHSNKTIFILEMFRCQIIPSLILDGIFKIMGKNPMLFSNKQIHQIFTHQK